MTDGEHSDSSAPDLPEHWDQAYAQGVRTRSWFEESAGDSLEALDRLGVTADNSLIDIGSGAAPLVDALLRRGHRDLTCVDISQAALQIARDRLGAAGEGVTWLAADLRTWQPTRAYAVWHDRAVLHFQTSETDRTAYLRALSAATRVGSVVALAAFAPDGPDQCSGLPVRQYDGDAFAALLGADWAEISRWDRTHLTPWGAPQAFSWWVGRRLH